MRSTQKKNIAYLVFGKVNSKLERITFSVDKNEAWYSSTPTIEDGSIFLFKDADQNKLDVIYEQIKTGICIIGMMIKS